MDQAIFKDHGYLDLFQAALRYSKPWIANVLFEHGVPPIFDVEEMKKHPVHFKELAHTQVPRNAAALCQNLELKASLTDEDHLEVIFQYMLAQRVQQGQLPTPSLDLDLCSPSSSFWETRFGPSLIYLYLSSGDSASASQLARSMIEAICISLFAKRLDVSRMMCVFHSMSQMYVKALETCECDDMRLAMRVVSLILSSAPERKYFFHRLCSLGLLELVRFVIEIADHKVCMKFFEMLDSEKSALYLAAVNGHFEVAKYLVNQGCPLSGHDGFPVLHGAIAFLKSTQKLPLRYFAIAVKFRKFVIPDSKHVPVLSHLTSLAVEAVKMCISATDVNRDYFFQVLTAISSLPSLTPVAPVLVHFLQCIKTGQLSTKYFMEPLPDSDDWGFLELLFFLRRLPPPRFSSQASVEHMDKLACHFLYVCGIDSMSTEFLEAASKKGLWRFVAKLMSSRHCVVEDYYVSYVFTNAMKQGEIDILDDLCSSLQRTGKLPQNVLSMTLCNAVKLKCDSSVETLLKFTTEAPFEALGQAIQGHHDTISDLLLGFIGNLQQPLQDRDFTRLVKCAASSNNQLVLEKLFQMSFENPTNKTFQFWSTILEVSVRNGHEKLALQAVGCLTESQLDSLMQQDNFSRFLDGCCWWGMKDILECLPFTTAQLLEVDESEVSPWMSAVGNGHIGKLSYVANFPSLEAALLETPGMARQTLAQMLSGSFRQLVSRTVQEGSSHAFNWVPTEPYWPSLKFLAEAYYCGLTENVDLCLQKLGRFSGEFIVCIKEEFGGKCDLLAMACSRSGNLPLVELTLRHLFESPSPSWKETDFDSGFLLSVQRGEVEYAKAFIRCIPNVFERTSKSSAVLRAAVRSNSTEMVDYILELHGSNAPSECFEKNERNEFPLYLAFALGCTSVTRYSNLLQTAAKSPLFYTASKPNWRSYATNATGWFDALMQSHTRAFSAPSLNTQCTGYTSKSANNILSLRAPVKPKNRVLQLLQKAVDHEAPTLVEAIISANGGVFDQDVWEVLIKILPDPTVHSFLNAREYRRDVFQFMPSDVVLARVEKLNSSSRSQDELIFILENFRGKFNRDILKSTLVRACWFGKEKVVKRLIGSTETFDDSTITEAISMAIDNGQSRLAANLKLSFFPFERCQFTSTHPIHRCVFGGDEDDYHTILQGFFTSLSAPCQRMPSASHWLVYDWSEEEAKIMIERLSCTKYAPPNPWVVSLGSHDLAVTIDWDSFSKCLLTSPGAGTTRTKFHHVPLLVEATVFSQAILGQIVPQTCSKAGASCEFGGDSSTSSVSLVDYCQQTGITSLIMSCVVFPMTPSFSVFASTQGILTISYSPTEGAVVFPDMDRGRSPAPDVPEATSPDRTEAFTDLARHCESTVTSMRFYEHCTFEVQFSSGITDCSQENLILLYSHIATHLNDVIKALELVSNPLFLYREIGENWSRAIKYATGTCPFERISVKFDHLTREELDCPIAVQAQASGSSLLTISVQLCDFESDLYNEPPSFDSYNQIIESLASIFLKTVASSSLAQATTIGQRVSQTLKSSICPSVSPGKLHLCVENQQSSVIKIQDCDLADPENLLYLLSLKSLKSFLGQFYKMLGVFSYKPRLCSDVSALFADEFRIILTRSARCEFILHEGIPQLTIPAKTLFMRNFNPVLLTLFQSVLLSTSAMRNDKQFPPPSLPAPLASHIDMDRSPGLLFPVLGVPGIITVQLVDYHGSPVTTLPSVNCHLDVRMKYKRTSTVITASSSDEPSASSASSDLLVRLTSSGTFEVTWTPQSVGQCDIALHVNGTPISNSPFRCCVLGPSVGGLGIRQAIAGSPLFFIVSHPTGDGSCCDISNMPPVKLFGRKPIRSSVKTVAVPSREEFISGLVAGGEPLYPMSLFSAYGKHKKWSHLSDVNTLTRIHISSDEGNSLIEKGFILWSISLRNGCAQVRLSLNSSGNFSMFASCARCNCVLRIHWSDKSDILPSMLYVVPGNLAPEYSVLSVKKSSGNVSPCHNGEEFLTDTTSSSPVYR